MSFGYLQSFVSLLGTWVNSHFPLPDSELTHIADYSLVKPLVKNMPQQKRFFIGIYQRRGKQYFLKTWRGKFKDYDYYLLQNEYQSIISLSKYFTQAVRLPHLVSALKSSNQFTLVYEVINGQSLSHFSSQFQVKIINQIISEISTVNNLLSASDKLLIPKRYLWGYTIQAFAGAVKTLTPKYLINIFYTFPDLFIEKLSLSHGDIHSKNVILKDPNIYLTDLETVSMSPNQLDRIIAWANSITHSSVRSRLLSPAKDNLKVKTNIFILHKLLKLSSRSQEFKHYQVLINSLYVNKFN